MIKMISKSLALLALLFLSFGAVAQEICVLSLQSPTTPTAMQGVTEQNVTKITNYSAYDVKILDAQGNPTLVANSTAKLVDEYGADWSGTIANPPFNPNPLGQYKIYLKSIGYSSGWVTVRVFYSQILGNGNSTRDYTYLFLNSGNYTNIPFDPSNPTDFIDLSNSSYCAGDYTVFRIKRSSLKIFSYSVRLQEVNIANQVVSGGLDWNSGTRYTTPAAPATSISIIPQSEGFTCSAGKRYKLTLSSNVCGTTYSNSRYYNISNCPPSSSSTITPQGTDFNDNGTIISSFCAARSTLPVALSTSVPTGAPPVTGVTFFLQEMTAANCIGAIGSEVFSQSLPLASSYDLRTISQFNTTLALNGAQVKYFRVRAEISNVQGTRTTPYRCFRITNDQLLTPGFHFTTNPGSPIDIDVPTDGLIFTTVPPVSASRGYALGPYNCGVAPIQPLGVYDNYRIEILRRDNSISGSVFTSIFDSGVLPFPITTYPFIGPTIQGSQTYFIDLSNADKGKYDFQCRMSLVNDCGWFTYTKPFYITTTCAVCRPVETPSIELDAEAKSGGIATPNTALSVALSPNPSDGIVYFELTGTLPNTESRLQIMNLHGQIIESSLIPADHSTFSSDISQLPAGIYIYSLHHGNDILTGKVIKL